MAMAISVLIYFGWDIWTEGVVERRPFIPIKS